MLEKVVSLLGSIVSQGSSPIALMVLCIANLTVSLLMYYHPIAIDARRAVSTETLEYLERLMKEQGAWVASNPRSGYYSDSWQRNAECFHKALQRRSNPTFCERYILGFAHADAIEAVKRFDQATRSFLDMNGPKLLPSHLATMKYDGKEGKDEKGHLLPL